MAVAEVWVTAGGGLNLMGGTAWEVEVTAPVVPRGELSADDVADTDKHHNSNTFNKHVKFPRLGRRQPALIIRKIEHKPIKQGARAHLCIPHTEDAEDGGGMGNFDGLVPALGVDLVPV